MAPDGSTSDAAWVKDRIHWGGKRDILVFGRGLSANEFDWMLSGAVGAGVRNSLQVLLGGTYEIGQGRNGRVDKTS